MTGGVYNSISRKTFKLELNKAAEAHKAETQSKLRAADAVCLTADIWSNKKRSFLGVTAHIIDKDTLQRESFAMACERFSGTHDFQAIAEKLSNIIREYNLLARRVCAIVTDNATNFSKAFVVYGLKDVSLSDSETLSLSDDSDNLVTFEEINLDCIDEVQGIVLPPQKRCASHTLSLVATTDVTKNTEFRHKSVEKVMK